MLEKILCPCYAKINHLTIQKIFLMIASIQQASQIGKVDFGMEHRYIVNQQ